MSRVEIARRFALAAREAEEDGKHRRAAELYAEALRVLLDRPSSSLESGQANIEALCEESPPPASSSVQPKKTMVRLTQKAASTATGASADAGEAALAAAGELEAGTHVPRAG
jgi:hypothetical protein